MPVRILIAEDHAALRADLRALLEGEAGLMVVGEARNAAELRSRAGQARPDVILLALDLPGLHGFATVRQLGAELPAAQILLLTHERDPGLGRDALLAGAAGCVHSHEAATTLTVAVRAVAQGQLYIEQGVIRALLTELLVQAQPPACEALTGREVEVLQLLAQGYTNRQAAAALGLSVRTVESHRAKILEKLDLHSRADLVRYAVGHQLLERPVGDLRAQ